MKAIKTIIILACAVIPATACDSLKEKSPDINAKTALKISSVASGISDTRSVIEENTLADGAEIGISISSPNGSSYDGMSYENIRFSAEGSGTSQSWHSGTDVMLSANKAVMYAYYPYSADVKDISSIEVHADSENQTDYMFATAVKDLNNANPSAAISLNHAMAAVRLSVERGTYSGKGLVSSAYIKGRGAALRAVLDASRGTLSSISGEDMVISPKIESFTISETAETIDIIAIPNGQLSPVEIGISIDGTELTTVTEPVLLKQGTISSFKVSVNNGSISLSDLTVKDWGYTPEGELIIQNGHKVTICGDIEGISFDNCINEDGSILIKAIPYAGRSDEINPVDISGSANISQSLDQSKGILSIMLSELESDISISFNGYSRWIRAKYNVTNTNGPTKIFYEVSGRKNIPLRMKINGSETEVKSSYEFAEKGIHDVRLALKDRSQIPELLFYEVRSLREIEIPEGTEILHPKCFQYCSSLKNVSLPESIRSIGYECFRSSTSLESIILPENAIDFDYSVFKGCMSLKEVQLPSGLGAIPDSFFEECSSLSSVILPDEIRTLGSSCFMNSGLSVIDLPAGLTYIDMDALRYCYKLKCIISRAVTAPKLYSGMEMFFGIPDNGVIYVPAGSEQSYASAWLKGELLDSKWTISAIEE